MRTRYSTLIPERHPVRQPLRGSGPHRGLADQLQQPPTPLGRRLAHPGRVRRALGPPTAATARIQALRAAQRKAFVILDGTLIATDRLSGTGDRLFYSGKHRRHGVNVQFLTGRYGELIWASPALPGSTHDLTAARAHGIIAGLTARAIACYADKGYIGVGGAIGTPYKRSKGRRPGGRKKLFNRHHAQICALLERGAATSRTGTSCAKPAAHPAA